MRLVRQPTTDSLDHPVRFKLRPRNALRALSIIIATLMVLGEVAPASEQNNGGLRYCGPPGQFGKICVAVSSRLPNANGIDYGPRNLIDHNPATAWVEGAAGDGVGEWVSLSFDYPMKFSRIFIRSGDCKSEETFSKNNAPRTVRIITETRVQTLDLERTMQEQTIRLPAPVTSRWVKLEIRSVSSWYRNIGTRPFQKSWSIWKSLTMSQRESLLRRATQAKRPGQLLTRNFGSVRKGFP